jgi:hypothetical protein
LHVAAAFRLGGTEVNPFSFAPFGGLEDGATVENGHACFPDRPGIGFESRAALSTLLKTLR